MSANCHSEGDKRCLSIESLFLRVQRFLVSLSVSDPMNSVAQTKRFSSFAVPELHDHVNDVAAQRNWEVVTSVDYPKKNEISGSAEHACSILSQLICDYDLIAVTTDYQHLFQTTIEPVCEVLLRSIIAFI